MGTTKVIETRRKDVHAAERTPAESSTHAAPSAGMVQVGAADDRYEQAADRAADAAVRRLAAGGALGESAAFGTAPRAEGAVGAAGGAVDERTADRIEGARGGGSALPSDLRRSMETAFGGANFGGVRLHSGTEAADLNAQVGAHAFTVGTDIFLGDSMPALDSQEGQHTLAHELAHTQQPAGTAQRTLRRLGEKKKLTGYTKSGTTGLTVNNTPDAPDGVSDGLETGGNVAEVINTGGGSVNDAFNGAEGYEGDYTTATGTHNSAMTTAKGDAQLSYAGAAFSSFALLADGAAAVKVFIDNGKATEKAEAIISATASTASLASSAEAAKKSKEGLESADGNASVATQAAAGILEEVAGALNTFKAGYKLVKDIVQLIRKGDDMDNPEKVERTGIVLKTALEGGKGIIDVINGIYHKAGHMTTSLLHAAPGIGIAMNVMDSILNGVNIGFAYLSYSEMQGHKRTSKASVQDKAVEKRAQELFDAARTKPVGQRLTMEDARALAHEEYGAKDTTVLGIKVGHRSGKAAAKYLKDKAAAKLAAATTPEEQKAAQAEINETDDYSTSRGLQNVAAKRIKRGILNISTASPAIAGDIITLSGIGAAIGGGLKAASGGAKGLAVLVRLGKQAIRDVFKVGSEDKTTEGKAKVYDSLISHMVRHITEANEIDATMDQLDTLGRPVRGPGAIKKVDDPVAVRDKTIAQKKAAAEVEASGMRPRKISDLRAEPKELYKEWVTALKKR